MAALDNFYARPQENATGVPDDYMTLIGAVRQILQTENDLSEIIQLVGKDSLSEDQKLTVELAKLIKEDFLQQNGFSDHDRFCPNIKTYWMLKNFVNFYDQGMKAITNSDSERRITFALIRTTLEKEYVALTQMKFIVPPKNPNNYGRDIIAPMTALNEQIARGYPELEA